MHLHNRLPLIYGAPAGRLAGAVVVSHAAWTRNQAARASGGCCAGRDGCCTPPSTVSPEIGEHSSDSAETFTCRSGSSVIENGINLRAVASAPERRRVVARRRWGSPRQAWVMGSVGRFAPEKDYPFLVRAAAPLLGADVRLVIVGDGTEMPAVKTEVAARQVEPFVCLPGLRDDVPELLAALDVFVLSSRMEGLPLVVLEAMATGLPVVATAVGGLPKLLTDGETGFLVPAGDETALRSRLASLRADPAAARAVAERGRARVRQHHSRDRMVGRYLDLYQSLGRAA